MVLPTPPLGETTAIVLGRVIGAIVASFSSTSHSRRLSSLANVTRSQARACASGPLGTGRPAFIGWA